MITPADTVAEGLGWATKVAQLWCLSHSHEWRMCIPSATSGHGDVQSPGTADHSQKRSPSSRRQ